MFKELKAAARAYPEQASGNKTPKETLSGKKMVDKPSPEDKLGPSSENASLSADENNSPAKRSAADPMRQSQVNSTTEHPETSNESIGHEHDIKQPGSSIVDEEMVFDVEQLLFAPGIEKPSSIWGPKDREVFAYADGVPYRTFNSVIDHPVRGDERHFVFVRRAGTDDEYRKSILIDAEQYYEICIFFRNDASENLNESGKGIGNGVRVSIAIPHIVKNGSDAAAFATITSLNTTPSEIWDIAVLQATSDLCLKYVNNSGVIHSNGDVDGTVIEGNALMGDQGVNLGHWKNHWGIVPAGDKYAGFLTFELKAEKVPCDSIGQDSASSRFSSIAEQVGEEVIDSIVDIPLDYVGEIAGEVVKGAVKGVLPI